MSEKCDLCGAEVRHTHPGINRETDSPRKICCACRNNLENPFEGWIKRTIPADARYNRIPCMIDQLADLSDKQVVTMCVNTLKDVQEKMEFAQLIEAWAIVRACEKEMQRRGCDDLLIEELKKLRME